MTAETFIGPGVSAIVVGTASWIAVRVSVARLEEQNKALTLRVAKIEESVNGVRPAFVRYPECVIMEAAVKDRLAAIDSRIRGLEQSVTSNLHQLNDRLLELETRRGSP